LSVNYGLRRRHGGHLEIQSAVGRGTTVMIRLPAAPPAAASPEPLRERPAVAPQRVLIVDDEADVLGTLAEMLETQGHAVTSATSGREALAHLERGAAIDLVLTDLGMPEMNGLEMASALRRRWPGIPVVLVTGWGECPPVAAEAALPVDLVIAKPVTLDTLADALARVAPSTC
jgi:CheY-like chemotaxis protein